MFSPTHIREHMEVVGSDGRHVGTVDHMDGEDQVTLTRSDSADGEHHFLPVDLIDHVDQKVHLKVSASEAANSIE
jgi:hypothetical protein